MEYYYCRIFEYITIYLTRGYYVRDNHESILHNKYILPKYRSKYMFMTFKVIFF